MKKRGVFSLLLLILACSDLCAQYSLYESGIEAYKKQDYTTAIGSFTEFLTKPLRNKKLDVDCYYYRALSFYKKEDFKNAVNDFQETVLLNRDNKANIYWFMAKAENSLGNYPESLNDYTNALRETSSDNVARAKMYYERSLVNTQIGNSQATMEDLNAGIAINPDNQDIKNALDRASAEMATTRTVTATKDNKKDQQKTKPATTGNSVADNKAATDKAAADKIAADKIAADKLAADKVTADKIASDKLAADKIAADKLAAAKQATDKTATDKVAADKIAADKIAADKIIADKLALADKIIADKKASDEKAAEEKAKLAEAERIAKAKEAAVPVAPTLADVYKDERRIALVIGNSKYSKEIGVLKNPANDATDMAKELRASNFDVTLLVDATYGQMRANMLKFKEKVDAGDRDKTVALFYYAGHGLQHEDENYLVPVDAALEYEDDIGRYCFPIQRMVLANMERSNSRMNIVILDACRNNPFPALNRSVGSQGLGEMKRARGSFIAYATAPGSVAADGDGRNGLYTQELLKAMRKPQTTIEQVFKEVRQNVLRQSGDKQNTWDSSNIVGDFYFKLQ